MECNCNNNNSNGGVIPWVRGNRLPLIICVYENVVTQEQVGDSTLTVNEMTRVPYTIQDNDTVTVIMKSGFRQVEMLFTTDGNKVMVTDNGELPTGAYTVEVTIERGDGARGRWQETRQVRIYENTSDAQLGEMYSIDADLFFYAKGDTGTGIADITNKPDGTLTITMTDGTSYVTEELKGDKGDKGDTGERGVSIVSFDVTGQTDVSVIYTVTFSDDTTQDISVPKGPQGDTGLTGNGISSTALNSDYTLTIAYTDGTTYTTPSIRGAQGAQGVSVIGFTQTGETATNTMYNLVFSDGRTQSVAIPKGVKGDTGLPGPVGPVGPQGPMGDVAVITPEQQAAFTMYSVTGQNTDGPMTQKAVTDALVADAISYDNSQKILLSENVQDALDEVGDNLTSTNDLEVSLSYGLSYNVAIVQGVWKLSTSNTSQACNIIPVKEGEEYHVVARTSTEDQGSYAWLTNDSHVNGHTPAFLSGYGNVITFAAGTEFNIIVPEGATYLYFGRIVQGSSRLPKEVRLLHKTKDVTEGNTSYLIDGMKMLSVGQAYEIGDAVRTTDMRMLRMTKQVKDVSSKDTISVGELKSWPGQRKTLVGLRAVEPYDSTHTYSSGDYALGSPNGGTVICQYSDGSWASVTFADMVSDSNPVLEEVDIDYIIENATEKNDVTHDIENHAGWVSEELFDVSDPLQMPYVYNSSFMSAAKTETGVVWTVTAKSNSVNYVYLTLPNMHYGSRIVISFDYKDEFAVTSIARADMLPLVTKSTGTYPTAGKAIGNIRPDCNHADFEFIYDNENIKYLFFQFDGGFATSVNKVLELSNISIKEYRLVKDEAEKDSEAVTYEVGDELNLTHYLARYGLLGSDLRWDYTLTQRHIIIPIGNASVFTITGGVNNGSYAFLSDYKFGYRQQALFAKGETRRTVSAGETQRVSVPAGTKWLMVNIVSGAGNDLKPASIVVSNIDGNYTPYKESRFDDIEETAAATKAILGNYEAADTYMNLQIVKAGRESAASCYWWYPHIMCTRFPYKRIYHTFCDGNGCAGVACINAFDKRAWKCLLKRMTFDGVDLHNTAMIDRLPDGRLICAYSEGHNQTTYMHIRISKRADDITEWNDAISINAGSDITYCQYHYVNGTHVIFSRIEHGGSWGYTKSTDLVNWSGYHKLIDENVLEGENKYYYMWVKPIVGEPNKLRFIGYGHPSHSPQYTFIVCGILDFENNRVCDYDGTVLPNYDGTVQQGTLDDMFYNTQFTTLVPNDNNLDGFGTTYAQRMYDLAVTDINTVKILFGRQKNQTEGRYWVYENINGVESTTMLCHSGLTFLNHSNTRAANGLCFLDEDNIIVSRSDEQVNPAGYDYIEKYSKVEGVWTKTKDVYKEEIGSEILRNAYPIASPDGKYVMWMRGHVDLDGFMNAKVDLILYDVDNDDVF